jgi:hypothetical protein
MCYNVNVHKELHLARMFRFGTEVCCTCPCCSSGFMATAMLSAIWEKQSYSIVGMKGHG